MNLREMGCNRMLDGVEENRICRTAQVLLFDNFISAGKNLNMLFNKYFSPYKPLRAIFFSKGMLGRVKLSLWAGATTRASNDNPVVGHGWSY